MIHTRSHPRAPRATAIIVVVLAAACICAGVFVAASRASAVFHELNAPQGTGDLSLNVDPLTPLWRDLSPGQAMHWNVEASLTGAMSGKLEVELRSHEILPVGLLAAVEACTEPFVMSGATPVCPGVAQAVLPARPVALLTSLNGRVELAELYAGVPRYILVSITLPAGVDRAVLHGTIAQVGLGVHASGDSLEPPEHPPTNPPTSPPKPPSDRPVTPTTPPVTPPGTQQQQLSVTGADIAALSLLGLGLIAAAFGVTLLRSSAASRRSDRDEARP